MLVEFRVANFRSFNEEQTLTLIAARGKDKKHPDNLIAGDKFDLVKAAAIYGANASGKSNLLKALHVMRGLVRNSATQLNEGDSIPGIVPFRLDPDSPKMPCRFEVTVVLDATRFDYGFTASAERVWDEWLFAHSPQTGRRQRWFKRDLDPETGMTSWLFGSPLKAGERKLLSERTRDNGLLLSRGADLNVECLRPIFLWFRKSVQVFGLSGFSIPGMAQTAMRVQEDPSILDRVRQWITHADVGIEDIAVAPDPAVLEEAKSVFSDEFFKEISTEAGFVPLRVETLHTVAGTGEPVRFDLQQDESNGTQKFFALAGPVLDALDAGALIVVDELECSMHPLLTRKLIELFQSPKTNKGKAQLIFATHDSSLMDPDLFRRDQIWLVEKKRGGASELFSLYDFDTKERPRATEAFERNYLAGRYGGVPNFGPFLEDL